MLALAASDEPTYYKLVVNISGIYKLTYDALLAAGIPLAAIDPRNLHIVKENTEVPISVSGEGDGVFHPLDTLLFYAEPVKTKYADFDIYRLYWDNNPGLRLSTVDASLPLETTPPTALTHRKTSHYETDVSYQNNHPSGDQKDHWYWKYFSSTAALTSASFIVNVENPVNTSEAHSMLKGLFKSYAANPRHHTKIYINDNPVYDAFWNAPDELQFNTQLPTSYLISGSNTIKVEAPLDEGISIDAIFINWFELE